MLEDEVGRVNSKRLRDSRGLYASRAPSEPVYTTLAVFLT